MTRKRPRENKEDEAVATPQLNDHAYNLFARAQSLESEDAIDAAVECYLDIVRLAEEEIKNADSKFIWDDFCEIQDGCERQYPPVALLASCSLNCIGGHYLDIEDYSQARKFFTRALDFWNENAMSLLNLANLEREHGSIENSIEYYNRVCDKKLREKYHQKVDIDWVHQFVFNPLKESVQMSAYMLAFLLHLTGRYDAAVPFLQQFICKYRVSPKIWEQRLQEPNEELNIGIAAADMLPVKLLKNVVPKALQHTFSPNSDFWDATDYKDRGYFSFWYDIERRPDNIVEKIIQEYMLPAVQKTRNLNKHIVGAEWWVHTRPCGRNLGHQLHFDTEENSLQIKREILHPAVSSVLYVSVGGPDYSAGPTVVFNQKVGEKMAKNAWVANPVEGGFLTFPGNLLHGVLPGKLASTKVADLDKSCHRLTLMVGFWDAPVGKIGKRTTLGPCAPLPRETRGCTWPAILKVNVKGSEMPDEVQLLPTIKSISPAWEEIPATVKACSNSDISGGTGSTETSNKDTKESARFDIPVDVDQRFFVNDMEEFRAHLVERILGS